MAQLTQWLWREEYWLPPGFTWEDMQETEDIRYPQPRHLLLCIPMALLLVALRFLFERKIAIPLGKKLGLQEKVRWKPPPNQILEAFYTSQRKNPQKEEVRGLAKQCDLQPRQVERWFRYRLNQSRPSVTKKFCEASSRTLYAIIFSFTLLAILYDKSWFWNVRECLDGYPQQPPQVSLLGYYLMQNSYYWSLLITVPFDIKEKDYNMIIVHHVITVFLTGFSYCVNFIRISLFVMLLHNVPDFLLYSAKMFNYLKWQKTCDTLFILFAVGFILARGIFLPYKVLYNTYYYLAELHQPYFGYYFLNALLTSVYLLGVFWSWLILLMIYKFLIHGKVEKDVRSDSESSEEEVVNEVDQKAEQKQKQNSTIVKELRSRCPNEVIDTHTNL